MKKNVYTRFRNVGHSKQKNIWFIEEYTLGRDAETSVFLSDGCENLKSP